MTSYSISLSLIEFYMDDGPLVTLLRALSAEVIRCHDAIDEAVKTGDADYIDAAFDNADRVTEELMSSAFLNCHLRLNGTHALIRRIHDKAKQDGHTLTCSDGTKRGIFRIGSTAVPNTGFTQIEAIQAFANYAKHSEEWQRPWSKLKGRDKDTADTILAFGGEEDGTENFRVGMNAIGIKDYSPEPMAKYVKNWIIAVHQTYKAELTRLNLL